jgi:hypothetical protein
MATINISFIKRVVRTKFDIYVYIITFTKRAVRTKFDIYVYIITFIKRVVRTKFDIYVLLLKTDIDKQLSELPFLLKSNDIKI